MHNYFWLISSGKMVISCIYTYVYIATIPLLAVVSISNQ